MEKSENINELATALAKAQGELSDPKAAAGNPFFNSRYATLAMVLAQVRPVFAKCGLGITQLVGDISNDTVTVTTMLTHSSGQWLGSSMRFPVSGKKDAQAVGSAITYCRRYMLAAITGVAQDDDDGNADVDSNGLQTAATKKSAATPNAQLVPNQGKDANAGAPARYTTDLNRIANGEPHCCLCGEPLDGKVYEFSMRNYKMPYCILCQRKVTAEMQRNAGKK